MMAMSATPIQGWIARPGGSMAVSGVCLTAADLAERSFTADLSAETQQRTTLGGLRAGAAVNLERPVSASDPLGGHVVLGHVDAVGRVRRVRPTAGGLELLVAAPDAIMALLVRLNRELGITVLMVTHESDMAAYAQRIVRFVDGRVESDTPNPQPAKAA